MEDGRLEFGFVVYRNVKLPSPIFHLLKVVSSFINTFMIKIAEHPNELNFAPNGLAEVKVNGKKVCVARVGAGPEMKLFACASACPHAGARMANGTVDGLGNIVCPSHRYKFSLTNGRNVSGEGYHLTTWKVEWKEDGVWLDGRW